jgi:hypothetical protein
MLNRWTPSATTNTPRTPRNPPIQPPKPVEDKALVFAQDTAKRTPTSSKPPYESPPQSDDNSSRGSKLLSKKPTNVCCKSCGLLGHTSAVCPNTKPLAQVHAMTESDDASEASDTSSVIILTQQTVRCPINPNFLLLDSQSTVSLFSNPGHVNSVRQATTPINVHCNKGSMPTSTVADFGVNEVYLNLDSIANVLSLYLLGKKHHITYDSQDHGSDFKVHTSTGVLEFKPTQNGLHALDLSSTPATAHVLVTSSQPSDEHLHVNTVRENFEGFTHCQVQRATDARCLIQMVASPTEHNFQSMVHLNLLKDCPVTHEDVTNTPKIFSLNLANIRGKTVQKKLNG